MLVPRAGPTKTARVSSGTAAGLGCGSPSNQGPLEQEVSEILLPLLRGLAHRSAKAWWGTGPSKDTPLKIFCEA